MRGFHKCDEKYISDTFRIQENASIDYLLTILEQIRQYGAKRGFNGDNTYTLKGNAELLVDFDRETIALDFKPKTESKE